jgi:hypothetical protein
LSVLPRIAAALAVLLAGCASPASIDGIRLPREAREGAVFGVAHQPADERGLDRVIVQALRAHGLTAELQAQAPDPPDFVVSYIDRWFWDMRTYLIDLRIDVRRAGNEKLVATARSYQTSLAAMGKTYQEIVRKTVDVLVLGIDVVAPPKPSSESSSGRRRR